MGTVYVQDLDDWDIVDKTFSWPSGIQHTYFSLADSGGEMFVDKETPAGNYQFKVIWTRLNDLNSHNNSNSDFINRLMSMISKETKKPLELLM